MNLSKKTILFCGDERNFKRCPTRRLKEYTKGIEDVQRKIRDKVQKARDLEIEADNIESEILKADSEELNNKQIKKLRKQAQEKRQESQAIQKEIEETADETEEDMARKYGELCSQILEPFTSEDFVENYDSRDMALVQGMGLLYDMFMSDFSEDEIQSKIQDIIRANVEQRSQSFQPRN